MTIPEKLAQWYYARNSAKTKLDSEFSFATNATSISITNEQAKTLQQEVSTLHLIHKDLEPFLKSHLSDTDARYKAYTRSITTLEKLPNNFKNLASALHHQEETISKIKEFTDTVISTEKDIYQTMKIEEHRLSVDFKHKLSLTFLRVFQIFIFVFTTYWAVNLAVWSTGQKNLVIPRGLINIVPSDMVKIAQDSVKQENTIATPTPKTEPPQP